MYNVKTIINSLTTYILSLTSNPLKNIRYKVCSNMYLTMLAEPTQPMCNVLLIKGGQQSPGCDSFYIRLLLKYLPNARVFVIDKDVIMLNHFRDAKDIDICLDYIRCKYTQPIYLVGTSLGGVVLTTYLIEGYDKADGYVSICSSLNVVDFDRRIMKHIYFRYLVNHICRQYSVNNVCDLYRYCGMECHEQEAYMNSYMNKVHKTCSKWKSKIVMIAGSLDPLTPNFVQDMKDYPIHYIQVDGGGHLSYDTLWYASQLLHHWMCTGKVNIKESIDYVCQRSPHMCATKVIKH